MNIREFLPGELKAMINQEQADRDKYALNEADIGCLTRYIEHRIEPGSFVRAVLCNNLREAMACADHINRRRVFEWTSWLYNNAPRDCWGNEIKVSAWLAGETSDD
jgi:hypothetical protein